MNNKSFTLIEVVIAISLLTIGLLAVYNVIQQTIVFASLSTSRLGAAYLAQEGIEIVRNIRDSNWLENRSVATSWDEGLTGCSAGCEADYTTPTALDPILISYDGGRFLYIDIDDIDGDGFTNFYRYIDSPGSNDIPTKFKRKIMIMPDGLDILEVTVKVSWEERGRPHNITAQENLYNWR